MINLDAVRAGSRSKWRGYTTSTARKIAIKRLTKFGFNYFVVFRDVRAEYALAFAKADWVPPGQIHIG